MYYCQSHTMLKVPVSVLSQQLSSIGRSQYFKWLPSVNSAYCWHLFKLEAVVPPDLDVWKRNSHLSSKGEIGNVGEVFGCWHILEVLLMCARCAWFARESVLSST
ncbi:hypothetical protein AVEN_39336-1 [Araneus ventricosus]|uniref:Uncharacterized protein n=1 Tax=Araneus ventricosus TaxID=182803 RepID=A0A4Y2PSF5_ARAVE|nr:hypothetical protein AVEN_39336-1 [Araneus ventricosus]